MENNLNYSIPVAQESELIQVQFYKKTYANLAAGVLLFLVFEAVLLNTPIVVHSMMNFIGSGGYSWLIVLGVFMGVTYFAQSITYKSASRAKQYAGYGLYVLAQAFIFVPIVYVAISMTGDYSILTQAGVLTLALFGGLTGVVFGSNINFSFLRTILVLGSFLALGAIIAGIFFGFNLGLGFSFAMVALASGSILYSTYQLKNEFSSDQYIGAALSLFASLMLLLWYILRILMNRSN